jgi:glycosyltransferase involved in cell wall biosynthesis
MTIPISTTPSRLHLVGYASAGLGLGEVLRRIAIALAHQPDLIGIHDFRQHMDDRAVDKQLWTLLPESCFDRSIMPDDWVLYLVNPDQLADAVAQFPTSGRRCGLWFWELERIPSTWLNAFSLLDEIWTPSSFVHKAIMAAAQSIQWRGKVTAMTLPLDRPSTQPKILAERPSTHPKVLAERPPTSLKQALDCSWWTAWSSRDSYRYYFSFDCHSVPERKNPYDLIQAFRIAFDDVSKQAARQPRLLLRVLNPERRPDCLKEIKRLVAGDSRVMIDSNYLTTDTLDTVLERTDVYVSLHRSEGLGLGMAEAMSAAKPCIATGWSGNLDFMDPACGKWRSSSVAMLLKPSLQAVPAGAYPHGDGQRWAHIDLAQAAQAMRWCFDFPAQAAAIGRAAKASIAQSHGPQRFEQWLKHYLFSC